MDVEHVLIGINLIKQAHMEIRHFILEGVNIKNKIQNYIISKFSDGIIYVNDVLVCNSNKWGGRREIVIITGHFQFNFENNPNKVLVHLGLGGAIKMLSTIYLQHQIKSECIDFQNWSKKWNIEISEIFHDQYKTFTLPS